MQSDDPRAIRATPRYLGTFGSEQLWTAGDWLIFVAPRDPRYTAPPRVAGNVHHACEMHYSIAWHALPFEDDPSPEEAVQQWVDSLIRECGGVDVIYGPHGRPGGLRSWEVDPRGPSAV